jgi:tetratricopeptide (TPR) repeat protein
LAQEEDETQRVQRIYVEGMRFFQHDRYEEAAVQFELAYRLLERSLKKDPTNKRYLSGLQRLRYFLGVCFYKQKQYKKVRDFLAHYLENEGGVPKSSRQKRAAEMLADAEKQIALQERDKPPQKRADPVPIPQPPYTPPPPRAWRPIPFVVAGLGLAALLAGGIVGGLSLDQVQQRDQAHLKLLETNDPSSTAVARLHHQAANMALTSNILYIAGGTITITGIILIITAGRGPVPVASVPADNKPTSSLRYLWSEGGVLP